MTRLKKVLSCVLAAGMLNLPVFAQDSQESPKVFRFMERLDVVLPEEAEIKDYSEPVKKGEFVWLAVQALDKGSHIEKQYLTFSDVKLDDWRHDNVIFGANAELAYGKGDGSFGINDSLDESDAALILMRALGFQNLAEAVGVKDVAGAYSGVYNKLFRDVARDGTVTVSEAYQMVYNMLQSDYVAMEISGQTPAYHIVNDQPYMTAVFDMKKESGRVTGNQYTKLGLGASGGALSSIEIDGVEYQTAMEHPEDFLGYYVDYYIDNRDESDPVVVEVIPKDKNDVTIIKSQDLEEITKENQKLVLHYEDGTAKGKTIRIPLSCDFVYNGKTADLSSELLEKLSGEQFGEIKAVNYEDEWLLRVTAYETMIVETYSDYDETMIGKNGERLLVKKNGSKDYRRLIKEGKEVSFDNAKKGDVLEYAKSLDGEWLDMQICNNTLTGKITSGISEDEISIDTVAYPLSNYFIKKVLPKFNAEIGVEQTFLFNTNGEVVDVLEDSAVRSGEYVFLLDARDCTEDEEHLCRIKYVTMNGAMLTSYLAEKVKLNGAPKEYAENVIAKPLLPEVNGVKQRQVIYIEKNKDDRIKAIYTQDQEGIDGIKRTNEILTPGAVEKERKCKGSTIYLQDTNDMNFPEFYTDSKTKILMVPQSGATDDVFNDAANYESKSTGFFVDAQNYIVEAYNLNEYNVAEVMLLRQAQKFDTQKSNNALILVTEVGESLGEDDQPVTTITGYQKGERVSVKLDSDDALYYTKGGQKKKIAKGDIIRFNLNNKGYATHNQYFKSVDDAEITLYPEGRNDGNAIAVGYVVTKNDTYLKLDFTASAAVRERVFRGSPASITIYDSKTGKCEKGVMADLTPGSKVLIRVFYSGLQDVILFR